MIKILKKIIVVTLIIGVGWSNIQAATLQGTVKHTISNMVEQLKGNNCIVFREETQPTYRVKAPVKLKAAVGVDLFEVVELEKVEGTWAYKTVLDPSDQCEYIMPLPIKGTYSVVVNDERLDTMSIEEYNKSYAKKKDSPVWIAETLPGTNVTIEKAGTYYVQINSGPNTLDAVLIVE